MKIQLNTDSHVQHDPSVVRHVEEALTAAVGRFQPQLSRVDVHLSDSNGSKGGAGDKRCLLEAHLDGRPHLTASDEGESIAVAVNGAARKLQRVIDSALGKLA